MRETYLRLTAEKQIFGTAVRHWDDHFLPPLEIFVVAVRNGEQLANRLQLLVSMVNLLATRPAVRHLSLLPARRYAQTNDEQEEMKEALQLNGSVSVKTQIHEREES